MQLKSLQARLIHLPGIVWGTACGNVFAGGGHLRVLRFRVCSPLHHVDGPLVIQAGGSWF